MPEKWYSKKTLNKAIFEKGCGDCGRRSLTLLFCQGNEKGNGTNHSPANLNRRSGRTPALPYPAY
jgi:hypothetical protein